MQVKITVRGDKAVLSSLKKKGQGFNNVMKAAVRTAGLQVENAAKVKLVRSRRETKITFTFKGGLEETEDRLQKVFKSVTK